MASVSHVPVTISPEAAARIAELGLRNAVGRMVDYAVQHLPELDRIEVTLYDRYELCDEPGLAIDAYSHGRFDPAGKTDQDLDRWMVAEFPPKTLQHVILSYRRGLSCAG
jgi:hypothetical protein